MSNAIKVRANITLKDGRTILKGERLEFKGTHPERPESVGLFAWNGEVLRMRYRNIMKVPSMKTLERWSYDGIAESVFGDRVEPDGYDANGAPSWLLAVGMI